ncbi:hypothetical protein TruAng_008374 [Truncatella angustata]|nr:hypothetical protein TruAng_008374 [Truncatella angustata]
MFRHIPNLEISNTTGACWTCIMRASEEPDPYREVCDKQLPAIDYDGNGWRKLVGVSLNEPALQNALLAISESHLKRLQRKSTSQSRFYIHKSLQHLQGRFQEPALLNNEITLMVLLVLLAYELCEGTDLWKQHFTGIAAWCQNRSDLEDIDPFLTTFITMVATQVVLHSRGEWRQKSYQILERLLPPCVSQNSVEVILGGSAALPRLIMEACRLEDDLTAARALSDQNKIEAVFISAKVLQSKIRTTQILPESQLQLSLLNAPSSVATPHDGLSIPFESEAFNLYEAVRCSAELFR